MVQNPDAVFEGINRWSLDEGDREAVPVDTGLGEKAETICFSTGDRLDEAEFVYIACRAVDRRQVI